MLVSVGSDVAMVNINKYCLCTELYLLNHIGFHTGITTYTIIVHSIKQIQQSEFIYLTLMHSN